MPTEATARFLVRGRVQGVGFRAATQREARRLGLTGLAVNRDDGSVEVLARGTPPAIDALAAWLERGPAHAQVASVEREAVATFDRVGFEVG